MFEKDLTVKTNFSSIFTFLSLILFSSEVISSSNEIVAHFFWVKTVNTNILTKTHKYNFTIWGQISICSQRTANNLLWSTHNMLVVCLRPTFWCLKIPNNCVYVFYYIREILLIKWKITDRPTDELKSKVETFSLITGVQSIIGLSLMAYLTVIFIITFYLLNDKFTVWFCLLVLYLHCQNQKNG